MLEIRIDNDFFAQPKAAILGNSGEVASRRVKINHPTVDGADSYLMRFEIGGKVYETAVIGGICTVPAIVLGYSGTGYMQWVARSTDGQLIGKSDVIVFSVLKSVSGENTPIPAPEDTQAAIDAINEALQDALDQLSGLEFVDGSIQEVIDARKGAIVQNTFNTLSQRLIADFSACITQGELETALANVTAAYTKADEAVLDRVNLNTSSIGMQRKNLLRHSITYNKKYSEYEIGGNVLDDNGVATINGITYRRRSDGSIIANGTATAISVLYLYLGAMEEFWEREDLILTGCPMNEDMTQSKLEQPYKLELSIWDSDFSNGLNYTDIGNSVNISKKEEKYSEYIVNIRILKDTTVSNLIFYPMLRYSDIEDDTYEPYKPSIQEQLDTLKESTATKDMLSIPTKNICIPVELVSKNGITVMRDYSGAVYLSGTSTVANPTIISLGKVTTEEGESYTVSGCPGTGSASTYWVDLRTSSGAAVGSTTDTGSGATFTAADSNELYYSIRIAAGANVDGLVVYPMVRYASEPSGYVPYRADVQTQLDALAARIAELESKEV